ncbi:hypothetical protein [Alicyclobacillus sacchari]|nr:hypothetical protein [Alicyclobacillus sacchari]
MHECVYLAPIREFYPTEEFGGVYGAIEESHPSNWRLAATSSANAPRPSQ